MADHIVKRLETLGLGWLVRLGTRLAHFANDRKGNVAMLYALALIPAVGATGSAVDLARAMVVKMRLAEALDAAGLAVGSQVNLTQDEMLAKAKAFFDANYPESALGEAANLQVQLGSNGIVSIMATASVDTAFMGVFGIEYLDVAVNAEITRETKGLEIALSLDNTGSMGNDNKLPALKNATTELINILFGDSSNPSLLKMGLIPFSETVRLDTLTAINNGWIDVNGLSSVARLNFNNNKHPMSVWASMSQTSWGGCVEARPNGIEETDTPPTPGENDTLWVPFFQPDEPDSSAYSGYGSTYMSDGVTGNQNTRLRNSNKYIGKKNSNTNKDCSMQKVLALTNSKSTLLSYVNGMQATGYTHIAMGAAWGWRVLSPSQPFSQGAAYDDPDWNKALVLMTDGVNTIPTRDTWHKSDYTAYGYLQQARLGTANANLAVQEQNTRTALVCERMKQLNIRIYTILLMEDSEVVRDLMRDCATSPELYFDSPTAGELQSVFQAIAQDLSNLRLSH